MDGFGERQKPNGEAPILSFQQYSLFFLQYSFGDVYLDTVLYYDLSPIPPSLYQRIIRKKS